MKKLLYAAMVAIILFTILPTTHVFAMPPAYIYLAQDRSFDNQYPAGPPKKIFAMGNWALFDLSLDWQADAQIVTQARTAITNWENAFPSLDWNEVAQWPDVTILAAALPIEYAGVTVWQSWVTCPPDRENAKYPLGTLIEVNSNLQWTDEGLKATIAHEVGHHYGLHDRYNTNPPACNNNEVTIMDGIVIQQVQPKPIAQWGCDRLVGPSALDRQRVTTFWYTGSYTDWTAQSAGGIATWNWKDNSWAEQYHWVLLYWWNGSGWTYYYNTNVYKDIGLHKSIEDRNIQLSVNVTQLGAPRGRDHCACGYPWLDGAETYGTWTCKSVYVP